MLLEVARQLAQASAEARALALSHGDLTELLAHLENAFARAVLRLEDVMVC